MSSTPGKCGNDRLISRLLIGKPEITPAEVRQLVPSTRTMDDHALSQKIEYMRRANARSRQLASHKQKGAEQ